MADTYEQNLGQKSSFTLNDFIRVVGTDNVSYKQLVTDVADTIITRYLGTPPKAVSSGDDLNSYTTVGTYRCDSGSIASSLSNCPVATVFNLQVSKGNNQNYTIQTITQTGTNPPTTYQRMLVTSTWSAWQKIPTRAEIDALNSKTSFSIRSVSYAYSIPAGGNTNTSLKDLIDADLPTGKTCLGVVGFASNDVYVVVCNAYYGTSAYSLQIRNIGESTRSGTVRIYYLCS